MKIKTMIKSSAVIISLLTLGACANLTAGSGSGKGGSSSYGLGSQAGLQGQNLNNSMRLRAPYNQSYYYSFNKSVIRPADLASIDVQGSYLVAHSRARVLLTGNTDSRGSREYNIALGERRAMSVANRLESDGVNKSQIRVVSYGAEKPVALGRTDADYAKNRRVDLIYEAK